MRVYVEGLVKPSSVTSIVLMEPTSVKEPMQEDHSRKDAGYLLGYGVPINLVLSQVGKIIDLTIAFSAEAR